MTWTVLAFFRHGHSFWEEQVAILLGCFQLGGKRLGYGELFGLRPSVGSHLQRHLPALFKPYNCRAGNRRKNRGSERASMHCLLSNSFLIRAHLVAYWLARALLYSSGIGIHPHICIITRSCLLDPLAHFSETKLYCILQIFLMACPLACPVAEVGWLLG